MHILKIEISDGVPPRLVVPIVARQVEEGDQAVYAGQYRWTLTKEDKPYTELKD